MSRSRWCLFAIVVLFLCGLLGSPALAHKKNCRQECKETKEVTRVQCDANGKNCKTVKETICAKWEEVCEEHEHGPYR